MRAKARSLAPACCPVGSSQVEGVTGEYGVGGAPGCRGSPGEVTSLLPSAPFNSVMGAVFILCCHCFAAD